MTLFLHRFFGLLLLAAPTAHAATFEIDGAELRWQPNRAAFAALGIEILEAERPEIWRLQSGPTKSSLVGNQNALPPAGIGFAGGPILRWPGGEADLQSLRLVQSGEDAFALLDGSGRRRFVLAMGHRDFRAEIPALGIHKLDVRLSPEFAKAIGTPQVAGVYLGGAEIDVTLTGPRFAQPKGFPDCSDATWPTETGADADLEMIDLPQIDETATQASRAAGRVIVTPAAEFKNVGTADLPWFQVFTTPTLDGEYCCSDGDGAFCQPYANDQQGLLIWNLYRLSDRNLQQIGRSGVKHAFNSTNFPCDDSARQGSARIAWIGCRDVYASFTNVDQDFLGYRDPVQAHPVLFDRVGSVFDLDGDDDCDNPSVSFVKCLANPAQDDFDRRLSVPESDLQVAGARYFMEAWYLVRDDIDIFNSFGFREVDPTFVETSGSGMWTFPFVGNFRNGPVAGVAATEAGFEFDRIDTGSGWIDVVSQVDAIGDEFRYRISIMNYDFDAGIDRLALVLDPGVAISEPGFFDGDGDNATDWTIEDENEVIFWGTSNNPLSWGTMFSFEYRSAFAPAGGTARLRTADGSGSVFPVSIQLPGSGADFVFGSGFEARVQSR